MKLRIMNSLYEEWINKKVIDLLEVVRYKKDIQDDKENTEKTSSMDITDVDKK